MVCVRWVATLAVLWAVAASYGVAHAAPPPPYSGTYVIVDPYYDQDVLFLGCVAQTTPDPGTCDPLAARNSHFLNPFTGVSTDGTTHAQAANGILLRIPWCGFQTGAASGQAAPVLGECHHQVRGTSGVGVVFAGAYNNSTPQLGGMLTTGPQGGIDRYIDMLSSCTSTYDIGGSGGCASSVMDAALNTIVTLARHMPAGSLKLSVSLMAGMYTPTSVLGLVPSIDLPQDQGMSTVSCARQPLTWHTTGTSPFVATTYEKAYTNAVFALGAEFRRVFALAGNPVQLNVIKESGTVSNSLEYDVAARTGVMATGTDPSSPPPQSDVAIVCPVIVILS